MLDLSFKLPGDLTARVTSEADLAVEEEQRMLVRAYVPGLEIVAKPQENPDIHIHHQESTDQKLLSEGNRLTVCDAWRNQFSFDIYHLLYSAARVKFLEKGLFSVHSSCVEDEKGHTSIVGHSGSGKTTTALDLVQNHGKKMSSGNKTLIAFDEKATMRVMAGTPTMTIRQSDRERYASVIDRRITYYDRMAFELNPKQCTSSFGGPLRTIVLVRLHDGLSDTKKMSPTSALHALYPYFLDTEEANTVVCGGYGVFTGTPPEGVPQQLALSLKKALEHVEVYSVAGPLSFVSQTISTL